MQGYTLDMIDPLADMLMSEAKRIEQECGVHPGAFAVACMITAVGAVAAGRWRCSSLSKLV